ncbi:MAG: hypothetical protein ABI416_05200 [Ginsengibacter sp.]
MLSCNKIFPLLFAIAVSLSSCMEQKILFNFNKDVNSDFFKEIPGLGSASFLGQPVTKKANSLQVYVSSFGEKFIEKDHVLEFTEINDSSRIPVVNYLGITGYSQELYLLKYDFTYSTTSKKTGKTLDVPTQAAVFFSVKHNSRGNAIGITPCYFGIINEEDTLIAFDTELVLKKDNDRYYLKLLNKNKKMNGLLFIPASFPSTQPTIETKFTIEKIVRLDPNKVGGHKPLVFDISKIFRDPDALQFHYFDTLHLTQ